MKRDLLNLLDVKAKELKALVKDARSFKKKSPSLKGKTLINLFELPSTRTRVASSIAMMQMGGNVVNLDFSNSHIGRGESMADTAHALGLYGDAIMLRMLDHGELEDFAKNSPVPVINGLSKKFHPTQTIGDLVTAEEVFKRVSGLKIAYVGDCGCNTAHETMVGFSKMGAHVVMVCPPIPLYKPDRMVFNKALEEGKVEVTNDVKAIKGADIIYTDVWVSMGFEKQFEQRMRAFSAYQVNEDLLKIAPNAKVMHCLPAHRGMEITDDVFTSKNSIIWKQAENRLCSMKAILKWLVK